METNNRFLEHDLAQEAEKARARKRPLNDVHANGRRNQPAQMSPVTTPKKDKSIPFRDGFDDEEVVFISPSKPKAISRPSTPKAGNKRKRAQTEQYQSPGQALPLTEPERAPEPEEPIATHGSTADVSNRPSYDLSDEKFKVCTNTCTLISTLTDLADANDLEPSSTSGARSNV